ncbi:CopG family ribbon-helix-helix protein [Algiphilus aromaticivorans]|jgi:predicted transcriptional regulator|uniref:CopG family ribbon-helix-helix protein n=1 Tax=Algiphilus aromaticivorans TaxID=382454 RepID=UPI0005C1DDBC|nr:transcriptional regulator [Algiphilus aromaticivorans]
MAVTTVRLRPEIEKSLADTAVQLKRSKGWIINQALSEYLAQHQQEQQRWQETLAAVESAANGKVIAGEKVHDWLQSWGRDDELPPPESGK